MNRPPGEVNSGTEAGGSIVRRLAHSTISNYLGLAVSLGTWFLLTPFIVRQLGSNLYGLWVLVGSVIGYGSLLDFGIASALTKYVAEFRARSEWEDARGLVGTAILLYAALGLIVFAVSALLAPLFANLFNVAPADHDTAVWLVVLTGLHFGLSIPCAATSAVLRGLQRFDLINLIGVSSTLLGGAAIVAVLLVDANPIGILLVNIAVMLLMQLPSIWLIRRIAPDLRLGFRGVNRKMAQKITSFSSSIFLLHVGGRLESQTDEIVIGAALPIGLVAPYNLARMISTLPQLVAEQFLTLLLPLASEMDAMRDRDRLRTLYLVSTRVTLGVFLALGVVLMVFGGPILGMWVGEEYAAYGHLVAILTLASLIDTSVWPGGMILQGMARHRLISVAALLSGLSNLALSIILVRTLGLTGVALGTLIPTALVCLGFVMPYCASVIGTTGRALAVETLLPALIPAIPALLLLLLMRQTLAPATLFSLAVAAAAGSGVYALVYLSASACTFERRLIHHLVANAWRFATTRLARDTAK